MTRSGVAKTTFTTRTTSVKDLCRRPLQSVAIHGVPSEKNNPRFRILSQVPYTQMDPHLLDA